MAEEFSIEANNDRREDDLVNVKQEDSEEKEAATEEEWSERQETKSFVCGKLQRQLPRNTRHSII